MANAIFDGAIFDPLVFDVGEDITLSGEATFYDSWSMDASIFTSLSLSANLLFANDISAEGFTGAVADLQYSGVEPNTMTLQIAETLTANLVFPVDIVSALLETSISLTGDIQLNFIDVIQGQLLGATNLDGSLEMKALSIQGILKLGLLLTGDISFSKDYIVSGNLLEEIILNLTAQYNAGYVISYLNITNINDIFETIVMNIKTKAFSRYDNYKFNSYATINGRGFGINSTGLVDLDKTNLDANTNPVVLTIKYPDIDINEKMVKKLRESYLMYKATHAVVSTTPVINMILTGDNTDTYEEDIASESPVFIEERIKYGRGLHHRIFSMQFMNNEGADVAGESFTVKVEPLNNRTR